MEGFKIILLCIVSAVMYGILHDQVTARVCVEYFTIGHPRVFQTDSPTLLALGWGVIATWWSGLLVGIVLAFTSRFGSWPKYDARRLILPVSSLLAIMACASLIAGVAGYFTAAAGGVWLTEPLRSEVPEAKHTAFLADLWAHLAAYGVGFGGGMLLCGWVLSRRWKLAGMADGANRRIDIWRTLNQFQLLDASMRIPYVSLLVAATVTGLFWNMGSYLILIHFVAPPLFGLLVAFLFRSFSWEQQFLILMSALAVSEFVRLITYCVVANGWRYISSDGETQAVMLFSFTLQSVIALLVWLVARLLISWRSYR